MVETPDRIGRGRQSQKGRRKSGTSKKSQGGREREGDEQTEATEMRAVDSGGMKTDEET